MLEFLGSLVSGGVLGLIGNGINLLGDYFKEKRKMEHEKDLRKLDIAAMKAEGALNIRRDQIHWEGVVETAEIASHGKMVTSAYRNDKRTYTDGLLSNVNYQSWTIILWAPLIALMVIVDFLRGITRPVMTWYSALAVSGLVYLVWMRTDGFNTLDSETLNKMVMYIVQVSFHLVGMAWAFWFCERNRIKAPETTPFTVSSTPPPVVSTPQTPESTKPPTVEEAREFFENTTDESP